MGSCCLNDRKRKEKKVDMDKCVGEIMNKECSAIEEKRNYESSNSINISENVILSSCIGGLSENKIKTKTNFDVNIQYFFREKDSKENNKIGNISGILKLFLLKFISNIIKEEHLIKIKNEYLKNIIQKLKDDIELINKDGIIKNEKLLPKDIQTILKEKKGNNIMEYVKYINSVIEINEIDELIKIFEKEEKVKISSFINSIIKYDRLFKFFEEEFIEAQKESIFDYSIISIAILDNEKFKTYEFSKNVCQNCITKLLFRGTQIDNISEIISTEFKYTKKAFYGMGIYFTDSLDYVLFYSGDINNNKRSNFNKILSPNSTFGIIASEIFYNEEFLKHIKDYKYKVNTLDHFPTYEEIKLKYPDKMVPKNGIHFINVKPDNGHTLSDSKALMEEKEKGKFIGNEYVITELNQICPIFGLKLKRNEFFVLWRDPNFKDNNRYTEFLKRRELFANEIAKMNIYIESSTEKALKFIQKRRYNKIILITSIGKDYSGKKFIEIARKIIGSNIIVLIFSSNKEHLNWIEKYTNVLYTNNGLIYEKYIMNYNEKDLKDLKNFVEEKYKIKLLDFTNDFLSYPHYIDNGKFSEINCSEKSPYIRHVQIINSITKYYLIMNEDGSFNMIKNNEIKESDAWDITLDENELTLFSKGYYLGVENKKDEIRSDIYMKIWNYEKKGKAYIIKSQKKNNLILSESNGTLILSDISNNSTFEFIDI